jgi:hypothetical protein
VQVVNNYQEKCLSPPGICANNRHWFDASQKQGTTNASRIDVKRNECCLLSIVKSGHAEKSILMETSPERN